MIIAKINKYALKHKTYLYSDHIVQTHDIEIVYYCDSGSCFTIATFNDDGELVSCGRRLMEEMHSADDLDAVRTLSTIAEQIICNTDNGAA